MNASFTTNFAAAASNYLGVFSPRAVPASEDVYEVRLAFTMRTRSLWARSLAACGRRGCVRKATVDPVRRIEMGLVKNNAVIPYEPHGLAATADAVSGGW
jgi:hypothetical protein